MGGIDCQRRQHRPHLGAIIFLDPSAIFGARVQKFEETNPVFGQRGRMSSRQQVYCSSTICRTRSVTALKVSVAVKPSMLRSTTSLSICCFMPATRTSKNSSRFELMMQKNLRRSSSGLFGSSASSSTRWLNSSQLNSRLMKWEVPWLVLFELDCTTTSRVAVAPVFAKLQTHVLELNDTCVSLRYPTDDIPAPSRYRCRHKLG